MTYTDVTPDTTRGPWIRTKAGLWYFTQPRPEDVRLDDLLCAAHIPRFAGHCGPYSVGEHCLRVSWLLRDQGHDERTQLAGLIHDLHEVYPPGDVSAPVKRYMIVSELTEIEDAARVAVAKALGLVGEWPETAVRHADLVMLATEAKALMGYDPTSEASRAVWGELPTALDKLPTPAPVERIWWEWAHLPARIERVEVLLFEELERLAPEFCGRQL